MNDWVYSGVIILFAAIITEVLQTIRGGKPEGVRTMTKFYLDRPINITKPGIRIGPANVPIDLDHEHIFKLLSILSLEGRLECWLEDIILNTAKDLENDNKNVCNRSHATEE